MEETPETSAPKPETPAWTPPPSKAALDALITEAITQATQDHDQIVTDLQTKLDAATQQASDATAQLRDQQARSAIVDAALAAGTIDAETVTALAAAKVTVDDDGTVQGAAEAVAALKAAKPHLFRNPGAGARDASATTPTQPPSVDDWLRAQL